LTRTSRPQTSTGKDHGFTLVELLVVVALIGLIGAFALPSVTNFFKLSLNSTTREMASVIKEAYNSTAITGRIHRLVLDMKENQYWVEAAMGDVLLDTDESRQKEQRRTRFQRSDAKPKDSPFQLARGVTRKKISLPRGVTFEDVIPEWSNEPLVDTVTYAHFFPHGISEQAIIHLKDTSDHKVTLVITPLLGRTKLTERYLRREEVYAGER
jgi:prepilin-type N-terminal cleavage/methylation domain-containing protein